MTKEANSLHSFMKWLRSYRNSKFIQIQEVDIRGIMLIFNLHSI